MNKIKFSHNWNNKLSNDIFTTIRKHTESKEEYYREQLGEVFDVFLNDMMLPSQVKLVSIEVKKFNKINDNVLILDTGLRSIIDIEKVFYKFGLNTIQDKMIILLFEKVKGDTIS